MPSTVIAREPTQLTIVNTTAEADLVSFTVPGGAMGTTRMARLTLLGGYDMINTSTGFPALRLYADGLRWHDVVDSLTGPANAFSALTLVTMVAVQGSPTLAYLHAIGVTSDGAPAAGAGVLNTTDVDRKLTDLGPNVGASFVLDTSLPWTFRVTWQHAVAASDVRAARHYAVLELLDVDLPPPPPGGPRPRSLATARPVTGVVRPAAGSAPRPEALAGPRPRPL
jgi:hypothetical protein